MKELISVSESIEDTALRIGEVIRFHRKQSGLTQLEFSKLADVGLTPLKHVEQGKVTVQLDTLLKILKVLSISVGLESRLMAKFKEENG